ncbi:hypothetical protein [Halostella litorea]|uniref:hypothetical protein n=1 Tax=Halostella litorea TaxID=2528831 RepID=UPI001091A923|nr:hypothetical protein [Halostella litorea]
MDRSVDLSGDALRRLLYALQLAALLSALLFAAATLDGPASLALPVLLAALVAVTAYGLWRRSGDEAAHLGTAEDITYDPFADPGQVAKERWERAVRRLPDGDEED